MQTAIADFLKDTDLGQEAERILRSCVHCGFCLATCPTYNLLGNELDSPRGRIYLIKQVLEGSDFSAKTQLHLDRCLTCRSCETTCPSGVRYGHLLDAGRKLVDEKVQRPRGEQAFRRMLRAFLPNPRLMAPLVRLGQLARPLLPAFVRSSVPLRQSPGAWPEPRHSRRMLVLEGCVQPSMAPSTNAAAARVLDRLGISLIRAPRAVCCGAVSHHLGAQEESRKFARRNIDAWWAEMEAGVEAIVMTASGCGAMVKDYGHLLRDDATYGEKAARVSELTRDLSEVVCREDIGGLSVDGSGRRVAYHPPCTLQHGQKLPDIVEKILAALDFELTPIPDKHLCCGSAGTYSILQKDLSQRLLADKVRALQTGDPDTIATANIGCQLHIQSATPTPVRHWIELLDD